MKQHCDCIFKLDFCNRSPQNHVGFYWVSLTWPAGFGPG
jgi:hypothetical protein